MKWIGVDVGGTFTDVVLFDTDSSETAIHKVPTTVDDPSRGVMQGVLELGRAYLSGLTLPEVALPHLRELVGEVRESSSVAVLDGERIVYVAHVAAKRVLSVSVTVGRSSVCARFFFSTPDSAAVRP